MGKSSAAIKGLLVIAACLLMVGLYLSSLYSYLLFHSIVEIFSIVVACAIFVVAWNSRPFMGDGYFLLLGVGYLFVGATDAVHMLAYKGMGVFPGLSSDLATQLWIAARYIESATLLTAAAFIGRKIRPSLTMLCGLVVFVGLLVTIFVWPIFPACFVEGQGLTDFKIGSEYVICVVLAASVYLLLKKRQGFDRGVLTLLVCSVIVTILSELAFTLYTDVYGLTNLVGHFLKLVSFCLIYKAVVETGLAKPYKLLFRDLQSAQDRLNVTLNEQEEQVHQRTTDLNRAVTQLQAEAVERIKAEQALHASHHFLQIAYRHNSMEPLLDEFAQEVRELAKCEAVGIRVTQEDFTIPYKAYLGFPKEFYDSESFLSLGSDRCMCISVIKGQLDPAMPFSTDGGSFYLNDTTGFLANVPPERRGESRNVCNQFGYESVALVPIKCGRDILGLIHLADSRTNRIPRETVEVVEKVSVHLGTAIRRILAEQKLERETRRLSAVLQVLPGYVALIDKEYSVRFANDRFVELFGRPADGPCYQLFKGRQEPCESCHMLATLAAQGPREWERALNGRVYHVWGYPFRDVDGTQLVLEMGMDVTERKRLQGEVLRASETERRQIGRDLHDSIGQMLGGISCLSQVLHRKLADKSVSEAEDAAKIESLVAQTIDMTRSLSRGLNPLGLDPDGLMRAIRDLSVNVADIFGVRCTFRCNKPILVADEIVAMQIYRIAQEAINNAARHGKAKKIAVELVSADGHVSLIVTDDGVGIASEALLTDGMGLAIMKYRAESIGGSVDIRRREEGGTEVVCRLAQVAQRSSQND